MPSENLIYTAEFVAWRTQKFVLHPERIAADVAARRDWLHPRFNIEAMQNQIEALYRDILARKHRARA